MAQKTLQVHLRVTENQHAYMKGEAASYGIPLTLLMLRAVGAYARTYGEGLEGVDAVVVNYGVWRRVDARLGGIEAVLHETAQQLVGVRWKLGAEHRAGRIGLDDYKGAFLVFKSCHEDVERMREDVSRCTELIDRVCVVAHLTDPYLGRARRAEGVVSEGTPSSERSVGFCS